MYVCVKSQLCGCRITQVGHYLLSIIKHTHKYTYTHLKLSQWYTWIGKRWYAIFYIAVVWFSKNVDFRTIVTQLKKDSHKNQLQSKSTFYDFTMRRIWKSDHIVHGVTNAFAGY